MFSRPTAEKISQRGGHVLLPFTNCSSMAHALSKSGEAMLVFVSTSRSDLALFHKLLRVWVDHADARKVPSCANGNYTNCMAVSTNLPFVWATKLVKKSKSRKSSSCVSNLRPKQRPDRQTRCYYWFGVLTVESEGDDRHERAKQSWNLRKRTQGIRSQEISQYRVISVGAWVQADGDDPSCTGQKFRKTTVVSE